MKKEVIKSENVEITVYTPETETQIIDHILGEPNKSTKIEISEIPSTLIEVKTVDKNKF